MPLSEPVDEREHGGHGYEVRYPLSINSVEQIVYILYAEFERPVDGCAAVEGSERPLDNAVGMVKRQYIEYARILRNSELLRERIEMEEERPVAYPYALWPRGRP